MMYFKTDNLWHGVANEVLGTKLKRQHFVKLNTMKKLQKNASK